MPVRTIVVEDFISILETEKLPVIDSRSEAEFAHAHIPGAVNVPVLSNAERECVGTLFKQEGREAAIVKGFELVGPRFHKIITHAADSFSNRKVLMYCWRGGMRSSILAWLLSLYGFEVILLQGGYKSFRKWVASSLLTKRKVIVLGGSTGSGKTELLRKLSREKEQIIDLEYLANHKGSAFGGLGLGEQPSNEQFENKLALEWSRLNSNHPVWLENESRTIGSCMIPESIYQLIRESPLIDIKVGEIRRFERIEKEYGSFPPDVLIETTKKIVKRLGPQNLKLAVDHLNNGNFNGWLKIVMAYYDKLYAHGTALRNPEQVIRLDLSATSENDFVNVVKQKAVSLNLSGNIFQTPVA